MLRTEVLQDSDWADRLQGDWADLLKRSAFPTPFQSLDWLACWQRRLAPRSRPYVLALWEGSDLVGALPMARTGRLGVLRSMGTGPSDYLHPLAAQGRMDEVWAQILCHFESSAAPTVDLQQIREDMLPPSGAQEWRRGKQAVCLSLDLPSRFDAYCEGLSKSLRPEAKRAGSSWMEKKGLRFSDADGGNVQQHLQAFFDLHENRWRRRGLPGAFRGRRKAFQREWCEQGVRSGALWLRLLLREERPIGAIYAMRAGDACFFYQAGMDPAAKSLSPGTLLVASLIARSIEEGLSQFDFLRGDEAYKRRWQPQHERANFRLIRPGQGPSAAAAVRIMGMQAAVEERLRQRFER